MNSLIEIVAESAGDYIVKIHDNPDICVSVWKSDLKVHGYPLWIHMFLKQTPYEPVSIVNETPIIIENVKKWIESNKKLVDEAISMYDKNNK